MILISKANVIILYKDKLIRKYFKVKICIRESEYNLKDINQTLI
jgi:hypothetical protein